MNITVTHTLAPEILALLQNLFKSQAVAEQVAGPEFKETAPVKAITGSKKALAQTPPAPVGNATAATDNKLTIEDLRSAAQAISKSGKREQVLALVQSFGVDSLPKLDPSKFEEFSEKLKAL